MSVARRSHGRVVAHRARDARRVRRGRFVAGDAPVVGRVHGGVRRRLGLLSHIGCRCSGRRGGRDGRLGRLDPVHGVLALDVVRDERDGDGEGGGEEDDGDEVPPERADVRVDGGEERGGACAMHVS